MSEIPSWFWMVIIAGLSGMFGMILFYTAMLLREGGLTMREVRFVVKESKEIITSAKEAFKKINDMLGIVQKTVDTVSGYVIRPFELISSFVNKIKRKIPGFEGQDQDTSNSSAKEEPEYYPEDESPVDDPGELE